MQPPPIPGQDAEHLRLLTIFHYVFAGLAVLGIGFLFVHYLFMSAFFSNPEMWKNAKSPPPPAEFFAIFKWVYGFVGLVFFMGSALNLISASCLRRRRHRVFSIIVAAINCLQIPFGTALGVFTMIVLSRDSVRQSYEA